MDLTDKVRAQLIETGGRTSQDLGAGRIVGQVLVYLYLQDGDRSLDEIGMDLGLSKASVSIAARQLEQLGFARKMWKSGDRKNYYRSADNIGTVIQQGLLSFLRQKVRFCGDELENSLELLDAEFASYGEREYDFLHKRLLRARKLQKRFDRVLDNPIIKLFAKEKTKID